MIYNRRSPQPYNSAELCFTGSVRSPITMPGRKPIDFDLAAAHIIYQQLGSLAAVSAVLKEQGIKVSAETLHRRFKKAGLEVRSRGKVKDPDAKPVAERVREHRRRKRLKEGRSDEQPENS